MELLGSMSRGGKEYYEVFVAQAVCSNLTDDCSRKSAKEVQVVRKNLQETLPLQLRQHN